MYGLINCSTYDTFSPILIFTTHFHSHHLQLKVDMEKEALLLPINGRSVPFHISTVKSITMPEQDRATWMRINFFIPGVALGKDVAKNIQQLVSIVNLIFLSFLIFYSCSPSLRVLLSRSHHYHNLSLCSLISPYHLTISHNIILHPSTPFHSTPLSSIYLFSINLFSI